MKYHSANQCKELATELGTGLGSPLSPASDTDSLRQHLTTTSEDTLEFANTQLRYELEGTNEVVIELWTSMN